MSDLYLNEESYYFAKNTCDNEVFNPPFFNHLSLSMSIKKRVTMRAMGKKLNVSTLQLLIYYLLEQEVSVSARGKHLAMQLLWASARLLVTCVSLSR